MNILVTGAHGFMGRNLSARLRNLGHKVLEFDIDSPVSQLTDFCRRAEFVFNLAGINRPTDTSEFMAGNRDFLSTLLDALDDADNHCPVVLSSSIQAALPNPYGVSKLAAETLLRDRRGDSALIYRFPNAFGKWSRPNYNSVVATFCHNVARDLPITVNNPDTELTLAYIDDIVDELLSALNGNPHRSADGLFCEVPVTHRVTLGEIERLLRLFHDQPATLLIPEIPDGSFAKKLYSTYLSFLPAEKIKFPFVTHADARGSFTELIRTVSGGQMSVNVSRPGITKGNHWHDSKWEQFIVVSGRALIRLRQIGSQEIIEFEVSGDKPEAVQMLPGYTHDIINLSSDHDLVTLMWVNEPFDPSRPDTFPCEVFPEP